MFDTDDVDRIRGIQGDAIIVEPADLIGLADNRIDPSHRSSVSKVSYMTHIDTPLKQLNTNGLLKAVLRLTSVSALPQGVKDRK